MPDVGEERSAPGVYEKLEMDAHQTAGETTWEQQLSPAQQSPSFHGEGEQSRALLADHEPGDHDVEKVKPWQSKYERLRIFYAGRDRTEKIAAASFLAMFFFLFAFATFVSFRLSALSKHQSKTPNYGTTAPEDYVLDPRWDFEAAPRTREYTWVIQDLEHNPDGVYRQMLLINGQYPGPLIECNEGDTVVVHVDNQGVNATSLHWHGVYQNGTNWMDGTVGVTQCPIAPGHQFTYEFTVSGQWGTYWYHAHQATQSTDGLLGPLIIHSKKEKEVQKLPYTTDRVIMVQDYYHDSSNDLLMKYLAPDRENDEPVPDGALINGRNIRDCDLFPARRCDNSSASMPRLNLDPQENHRLRFINVGSFAEFSIQIDEHEFAITEVDGTDVQPAYYHRLNINPGQRYSVILTTNVTTQQSYWMRARMVTSCFRLESEEMEAEIKAVVRYDGAMNGGTDFPKSQDWEKPVEVICKDMNSTELVPVEVIPTSQRPDASFYLRSTFQIGDWRLSRGFFNQSSWRPDVYSPLLQRVVDGYEAHNESFTSEMTGVNEKAFDLPREMVIQVDGVKTIDIIAQNLDDGNHPLHLHGHKFFVLGQGHGYFRQEMYDTIDFTNPLRRDTASMEGFGWMLIRIITDNPGMWAFHCHISWHAQSGMMMQLLSQPEIAGNRKLPAANQDLCKAQGLEKGEGPGDDIWFGDLGESG